MQSITKRGNLYLNIVTQPSGLVTIRKSSEPSLRVVQSIHTKSSDINDLELRFIPTSDSTHWIQLLATRELLLQISESARLRKSFRNLRLNQGGKLMKIGDGFILASL
jgi:hypothetical protein